MSRPTCQAWCPSSRPHLASTSVATRHHRWSIPFAPTPPLLSSLPAPDKDLIPLTTSSDQLYHLFHPQLFQHRERKAVEGAAGEVEARREEVDTEDDATGEVEAGLAEADAEDGAARGIEDEGEKKGHSNGHARGN